MTSIIKTVIDGYNDLMENKSDPRVRDWFMMSSVFPTILICLSYAYFVKNLGPRLMANKKPFVLRNTILMYNLMQVFFSTYIFYEVNATKPDGNFLLISHICFIFFPFNWHSILNSRVWRPGGQENTRSGVSRSIYQVLRKLWEWQEHAGYIIFPSSASWLTRYSSFLGKRTIRSRRCTSSTTE